MQDTISNFINSSSSSANGGASRLAVAAAMRRLGSYGLHPEQQKALSAALNGEAVGGKGKKSKGGEAAEPSAAAKLAASLDAEGISAYLSTMIRSFLQAGESGGGVEGSGLAEGAAPEEAKAEEAASEAESKRSYAVEQLCTVVRFPATTQRDVGLVLRFLAAHAFLSVSKASSVPSGKAVAAAEKKKKKAGKTEGGGSSGLDLEAEEDLVAVGRVSPTGVPVSAKVRSLCVQRLFMLLSTLAPHKLHRAGQNLPEGGKKQQVGCG